MDVLVVEPVSANVNLVPISLNEYGVAEVDEEKCIGCGACSKVCPQNIIHVHECANWIVVKCSNKAKGAEAKKQCEVSCIGCGICEKTCTAGAIRVIENCAQIKESICLSCGMCCSEMSASCYLRFAGDFYPERIERLGCCKVVAQALCFVRKKQNKYEISEIHS